MGKTDLSRAYFSGSAGLLTIVYFMVFCQVLKSKVVGLPKLELKKTPGRSTVGKTAVEEFFSIDFPLATGNSLKLAQVRQYLTESGVCSIIQDDRSCL